MALLIDIRQPDWMKEDALKALLAPELPGVTIYAGEPNGALADTGPEDAEPAAAALPDVIMLAGVRLFPGMAARLPNLQLVQKLGAGVDAIVADPALPAAVRVARLRPDAPAREIAEYCLAYVLRDQRHLTAHEADAAAGLWRPRAPMKTRATVVAVLGLGHIGARVAQLFSAVGFPTLGWSRSAKSVDGVDCRAGADALAAVLAEADVVVSVLPSTPLTRDLFDAARFDQMKPGARFLNVGRGDAVVEADLIAALDTGRLGGAVLDVFRQEPLAPGHRFWRHPKVTVTPHVSGWSLEDGLLDVAENYRRLRDGQPLLHEVDRQAGY